MSKLDDEPGMRARIVIVALATAVVVAALGAIAGAIAVWSGIYNVAATRQHTASVFWVMDLAMKRSVRRHASGVVVPPLADAALAARGRTLHARHCVACHGAPGVAPEAWALGLRPLPGNLVYTTRDASPAELYWIVKYGIKMAGMPAWEFRLAEDEIWAVVAFLQQLPWLTPRQYRELAGLPTSPTAAPTDSAAAGATARTPTDPNTIGATPHTPAAGIAGDARRGERTIQQYGCTTCHRIPGIVGSDTPVGPPLAGMALRGFIAGVLPNTPENLVRWLLDPPGIDPDTAMPKLGLAERDAVDIAAYLRTLD